jgi:hypothetical protein
MVADSYRRDASHNDEGATMSILEMIIDYPKNQQRSSEDSQMTFLFISLGAVPYSDLLNPYWLGNDNQRLILCGHTPA